MTVAELIAALQQLPPDTRVMVSGYEGGLGDAGMPLVENIIIVALNVNDARYYGGHEEVRNDNMYPNAVKVQAIVL